MTATAPPPPQHARVDERSAGDSRVAPAALEVRALEVRGVVQRYRGGRGLGPIDLELRLGETLGIMGHNGSGKTTLLRLCATLDRPRAGRVAWFGADSARSVRRRLGVALDTAEEDASLSGRQAAHFWCSQWTGPTRARAQVERWLERLGLSHVADEPVAAYSFGMRRRLALVEALAHEPHLALLDEPTAGLDPGGAEILAGICAERSAAGAATLVASNDAAFVALACDRVAFLDAGLLAQVATPADLLEEETATTLVELDLDAAPGAPSPVLSASIGTLSNAGLARLNHEVTLAELVAAVDQPRGRLLGLRVRRATLADAYSRATGSTLGPRP